MLIEIDQAAVGQDLALVGGQRGHVQAELFCGVAQHIGLDVLQDIKAYVLGDTAKEFSLYMAPLTADERKILADGCLINFYKH